MPKEVAVSTIEEHRECTWCQGNGKRMPMCTIPGDPIFGHERTCPECKGTGQVSGAPTLREVVMPRRNGPISRIERARDRVLDQIRMLAQSSRLAAGMASEGYAGGYMDALNDDLAILRGIPTSQKTKRYWDQGER